MTSAHDLVGPPRLDEFVGQEGALERLRVHLAAARSLGDVLPHVLLTWPAGTGKTTLARLVASEMGLGMVAITRPPGERELLAALWELESGVLFLDEIHQWSTARQQMLLTLAEQGMIETRWGVEEFPRVTVVAATTEPRALFGPLVDRFPIRPTFEPYSAGEMEGIVAGMATRAGVRLAAGDVAVLAAAAGGMPRRARALVLAARDLALAGRSYEAGAVLAFAQIEADGLTRDHVAYLEVLVQLGGQAGLDVLAMRLRKHAAEVKQLEDLLLDRRMVRFEPRGRTLTAVGRRRLAAERTPAA